MIGKIRLAALLTVLLSSNSVFAARYLDAKNGDTLEAPVSTADKTTIGIANGKVYKFVREDGLFIEEPDEDSGQIHIRPTAQALALNRPIAVSIVDTNLRQYVLKLTPTPEVSADTIVIRDKEDSAQGLEDRSADFVRSIKNFAIAVLRPESRSRIEHYPARKIVPLWNESLYVLEHVYKNRIFVGEQYRITNLTNTDMILTEPEFFRRNVVGVVLDGHVLEPKNSINVYVFRKRTTDE